MAETLETIKNRKSTKDFKPDQISQEDLDTILWAGENAPVGLAAFDTIHFTAVQNAELIKRIAEAAVVNTPREGFDIYYGAPTIIIVSISDQPIPLPGIEQLDAGGIIQSFLLAATDLGLGSVQILGTIPAFDKDPDLYELLGIPEGFKAISSAAIGYATEEAMALPKTPRNTKISKV